MYEWKGDQYVRDGVVVVAAIIRTSGEGPWAAVRYRGCDPDELIGADFASFGDAKRAVEAVFA